LRKCVASKFEPLQLNSIIYSEKTLEDEERSKKLMEVLLHREIQEFLKQTQEKATMEKIWTEKISRLKGQKAFLIDQQKKIEARMSTLDVQKIECDYNAIQEKKERFEESLHILERICTESKEPEGKLLRKIANGEHTIQVRGRAFEGNGKINVNEHLKAYKKTMEIQQQAFERYASKRDWREQMANLSDQVSPIVADYEVEIEKLEELKLHLKQFIAQKQKQVLQDLDRVHSKLPRANLPEQLGPLTPLNQRMHPFGNFCTPLEQESKQSKSHSLLTLSKRSTSDNFQTPVAKKMYIPSRNSLHMMKRHV